MFAKNAAETQGPFTRNVADVCIVIILVIVVYVGNQTTTCCDQFILICIWLN